MNALIFIDVQTLFLETIFYGDCRGSAPPVCNDTGNNDLGELSGPDSSFSWKVSVVDGHLIAHTSIPHTNTTVIIDGPSVVSHCRLAKENIEPGMLCQVKFDAIGPKACVPMDNKNCMMI